MRRVVAGVVVLVLSLALWVPAAAQSPGPGASSLLSACEAGADDDTQLVTCQWVVNTILAPDPDASPVAYGADLPPEGTTLARPDATITLVEVDWDAGTALDVRPDDKANRYVAIRVLYQGTAAGASYNPFYWSVVDLDGFSYDQTFIGKKPGLESSNDLPVGRKAQGWITFEVPKKVHQLEVVESRLDGYLRWLVTEPS